MRWPKGFIWGTGASSTQCEGAAPASDWVPWEVAGHAPRSGNGNGFTERYAEDFALLAELGLTHHRMSIEWARIEPEPGVHDTAAVVHYRDILRAARDVGITPWVTLHHFTLPRWFADTGGFLITENRTEMWRRHVEFMVETFGDLVGGWKPVNEVNYYALAAYGGRGWPPGHDDRAEVALAAEAIQLANAEAAVRLRDTGVPVASIFGLSPIVALDESEKTAATAAAIYDALWAPGIGLYKHGVLQVPGRDPVERPDLAGAFDLIGFSYYGTIGVSAGRRVNHPTDAPESPLGYGIWADGVGLVLEGLKTELPDTPLLVAEFGVGTEDDAQRARYLSRGLRVVHDALDAGIDVRGIFHWTGVDNYEWHHGFDLSFGIIDIDRHVRPSAQVLATEARA